MVLNILLVAVNLVFNFSRRTCINQLHPITYTYAVHMFHHLYNTWFVHTDQVHAPYEAAVLRANSVREFAPEGLHSQIIEYRL